MNETAGSKAQDALTLQLLEWISQGSHSYAEVMDAWKSTCPRLTIWEDACIDGLVDYESPHAGKVSITEKGKALLHRASR